MDWTDYDFSKGRKLTAGVMSKPPAVPEQTAFSVCYWSFVERRGLAYLTYNLLGSVVLEIQKYQELVAVKLDDKFWRILLQKPYNTWTHACLTWTLSTGEASVYIDGQLKETKQDYKKGLKLPTGFVGIAQTQYENLDSGDPTKGFRSKVTDVNWWNRILTSEEVKKLYECRYSLFGNIISAEDPSSFVRCYHTGEEYTEFPHALDKPNGDTEHIKLIYGKVAQRLPEQTGFTMCFFMEINGTHDVQVLKLVESDGSTVFLSLGIKGTKIILSMNGKEKETPLDVVRKTEWSYYSSYCIVRSANNGDITFYQDGKKKPSVTGFETGYKIPSSYLLISQLLKHPVTDEEYAEPGELPLRMSYVNWWNRALDAVEADKAISCDGGVPSGQVIGWRNITFDEVKSMRI